jgi:outer membrane lipoprotein-sorting protein
MLNILILLFISVATFAQQQNADEILNDVKKKFESVKDYSVDLNIEVDMEFLRIPNVSAKAFFKQPDKMKIESEDYAILPKEGMNFSPTKLLNHKYSAIYVKADTLDNSNVDVVKIIPLEDSIGIVLSTLWIDTEKEIIRRIETTTKDRGSFQINLYYGEMEQYGLPQKMQFMFSTPQGKLPETLKNNKSFLKKPMDKLSENFEGNIIIKYSNYKVNTDLEDSFFEEKEKK